MTATITASHVLHSVNETMTVVRVDVKGAFSSARVLFADTFGNVRMKREFKRWDEVEAFVSNQLALDRPALHGTIDQIVPTPVAKSLHGSELLIVAKRYAEAMGFEGVGARSCVEGFIDGYEGNLQSKVKRLYGDAYRVGFAKGSE